MNCISVSEASKREIGEKIPALKGKITRINKYNHVGKGTCQNLTIQDLNTRTPMKLKIWDGQEVPASWANQVVYLISGEGKKGGLQGLEVAQDTYEWREGEPVKKLIEMREGSGATMEIAKDGDGQEMPTQTEKAPPREEPRRENPPTTEHRQGSREPERGNPGQQSRPDPSASEGQTDERPAPIQSRAPKTPEEIKAEQAELTKRTVHEAARFIGRRLNGFRMIFRAVDVLRKERATMEQPLSEEHFKSLCATIYIDCNKKGCFDSFPASKEEFEKSFPAS